MNAVITTTSRLIQHISFDGFRRSFCSLLGRPGFCAFGLFSPLRPEMVSDMSINIVLAFGRRDNNKSITECSSQIFELSHKAHKVFSRRRETNRRLMRGKHLPVMGEGSMRGRINKRKTSENNNQDLVNLCLRFLSPLIRCSSCLFSNTKHNG
jgi:hypothetical protein